MEVPVRVWEISDGVARGVRLDVGEAVEFAVAAGDSVVLSGRELGTHSKPTMVEMRRLQPWQPSWGGAA